MPTLEAIKRNFFDPNAILAPAEKMYRQKLSRFGAFIRRRAKSSIRKRKKVSEPGKPPTNRTGLLKKFILFAYEPEAKTVVAGAAAFKSNATAPELLEHGGVGITSKLVNRKGQERRTGHWRPRPFMQPAYDEEYPAFIQSIKDSIK